MHFWCCTSFGRHVYETVPHTTIRYVQFIFDAWTFTRNTRKLPNTPCKYRCSFLVWVEEADQHHRDFIWLVPQSTNIFGWNGKLSFVGLSERQFTHVLPRSTHWFRRAQGHVNTVATRNRMILSVVGQSIIGQNRKALRRRTWSTTTTFGQRANNVCGKKWLFSNVVHR